jgi:dsDNA-specific endonuclease/ATPase MutS2
MSRGPSSSEAIALLTLDLHPVFRSDRAIDTALRQTLFKAAATGVDTVQIIPGKGTGQLKKRVLAVLAQKHLRKLYARVETDPTNAGRILVHLR